MNARFTNHLQFYFFLIAALFLSGSQSHAAAWTIKKDHGQLIVTGLYYSADELYNNAGQKQAQNEYNKYELNPYLEYGLKDWLTIGTNLSLQRAHQDGSPSQTNWGIGDSEFFARARLWQSGGFVVSAEPMIKLPSPESTGETPQLGGHHPDAGLGLLLGYGFSALGQNHFVGLDTQYRYRFGAPRDQIKAAATIGIGLTPKLKLLSQSFITQRATNPQVAAFTQSSGDDYDLIKYQLSFLYDVSDELSLQAGGFTHMDGKNVGGGNGGLISLWRRF